LKYAPEYLLIGDLGGKSISGRKAIHKREQQETTGSYKEVLLDPAILLIIFGIPMYIVLVAILVPMGDPWKLGGGIVFMIYLVVCGIYLVSILYDTGRSGQSD
jgi:hypothetical protein